MILDTVTCRSKMRYTANTAVLPSGHVFKQGRGSQKSGSFMSAVLTTAGSRGRPPWIQDKVFPAWEQ